MTRPNGSRCRRDCAASSSASPSSRGRDRDARDRPALEQRLEQLAARRRGLRRPAPGARAARPGRRGAARPAARSSANRAGEDEGRADAGRALEGEVAAHQPRQPAADRQAEAGAAVLARGRAVGLRERLEQPPCCSFGMPTPVSRTVDAQRRHCPAGRPRRGRGSTLSDDLALRSVNLNALPTRFVSTCRTRSASPTSRSGTAGTAWVTSSTCFSIDLGAERLGHLLEHVAER